MHIAVLVDRSRRVLTSEVSRQSSVRYAGAWPIRHWKTRTAILKVTRWRAGSQWSCRIELAWCDHGAARRLQVARRRSGPIVDDASSRQTRHTAVRCNNPIDWIWRPALVSWQHLQTETPSLDEVAVVGSSHCDRQQQHVHSATAGCRWWRRGCVLNRVGDSTGWSVFADARSNSGGDAKRYCSICGQIGLSWNDIANMHRCENQLWQSVMFITTNNNFADDGTSIKRYYSKPLLTKSLLVTGASVCRTRSVHSVEVAKNSLAHDTEPGGSQWTRHNEPTQLEVNLSHHAWNRHTWRVHFFTQQWSRHSDCEWLNFIYSSLVDLPNASNIGWDNI